MTLTRRQGAGRIENLLDRCEPFQYMMTFTDELVLISPVPKGLSKVPFDGNRSLSLPLRSILASRARRRGMLAPSGRR